MLVLNTIGFALACLVCLPHACRRFKTSAGQESAPNTEQQHSKLTLNIAAHDGLLENATRPGSDTISQGYLSSASTMSAARNQGIVLEIERKQYIPSTMTDLERLALDLRKSQSRGRVGTYSLQALTGLLSASKPAAALDVLGPGRQRAALFGLLGGTCLVTVSHFLHRSAQALLEELEMIKAMQTTGVDAAVKAARARGLGKPIYTKLSGESWTDEFLKSHRGPAFAIRSETSEKIEEYEWNDGEQIYEERTVDRDGEQVQEEVDTGRRTEGKWVAKERSRKVEENVLCAATGICFRQLGAKSVEHSSPPQICVDLRKFDVGTLLEDQDEIVTFIPSHAKPVNVAMNNPNQQPPSRVLGHERTEQSAPLRKEIFALGHVSLQHAASVQGTQIEGTVVTLRPCPGKPFLFGFGSESIFQEQTESDIAGRKLASQLLGAVGYSSIGLASVAALLSMMKQS